MIVGTGAPTGAFHERSSVCPLDSGHHAFRKRTVPTGHSSVTLPLKVALG